MIGSCAPAGAPSGGGRDVAEVLAAATAALDDLAGVDAAGLSDGEVAAVAVVASRISERAASVSARAGAVVSARGCHADWGFRSAGSWLGWEAGLPVGRAKAMVGWGRKLAHMPLVAAAFAAGDISRWHVDRLTKAWKRSRADAFARAEAKLVDAALRLGFKDWCAVVDHFEVWADPDGTARDAHNAHQGRGWWFNQAGDRFYGDIVSDPCSAAQITTALGHWEQKLFEADWADARARVGDGATEADLARTPAQRRHDALVLMANQSMAGPDAPVNIPPLLHLVMDYATFARASARFTGQTPPQDPDFAGGALFGDYRCETIDGIAVHPDQAMAHIWWANVNRVVFQSPSCVLDYGRTRRFFTGALRTAMIIRDRTCTHDGCDIPGTRCQGGHRPDWTHGGTTSETGGVMECQWHNLRGTSRPPP